MNLTTERTKGFNRPNDRSGLRVLALVTEAFGGYGGIAQYNRDFLAALASNENIGEVVVLPRLGFASDEELPRGVLQRGAVFNRLRYSAGAFLEAARSKPDIVFSGHLYMGALSLALARLHRARLISQLHGTEIWKPVSMLNLIPLERSDQVLCVSRDTKAKYETQARDKQNAIVVANTVGADFTPGDRIGARKRFEVGDDFALLTVARLDKREGYKGHDKIIQALPHLVGPGRRQITYLIAGVGDDSPRLERLVAELGVTDRVRFLGKVPFEALPDLYRAADLFVLPSTGEGFGIVFLEAMACETPAFGVAAGGAPDALGDGDLGVLADPFVDITAPLQSAIYAASGDRELRSSTVQQRFGIQSFRRRVAQALTILH